MRSVWKGTLAFGLVSIPVSLFPAVTSRNISFRTLHLSCHTPLEYRKTCPHCAREVAPEEIARGYEYEKGHFVILSEEEIRAAAGQGEKIIELAYFARMEEIDALYFQKAYFLAPEATGRKPYALLRRTMAESGRVAIASVTLHQRQWPAVVRTYGEALSLSTIHYPDEVNNPAELPGLSPEPELREGELVMARELLGHLTAGFAPEKLQDHYREKLLEIIEARIRGQRIAVATAPAREKVVDLLSALQLSVEQARRHREKKDDQDQGEKGRPKRSGAAKKKEHLAVKAGK